MKMDLEKAVIHYEENGRGLPLIFLHGYHIDHKCLSIPVEKITGEEQPFRRIYPDLPGMGRTELRERVDSTEELYAVILEFIDRISGGGPFAAVGYSYGGYLARALARDRGDRLRGLFLVCPVVIPDRTARILPPCRVFQKDEEFISTLEPSDRSFLTEAAVIQTESVYKRLKEEIIEPFELADREMMKNLQRNSYGFDKPVDNLGLNFEGPVQFLAGHQDSVVGYEDIYSIFDDYPNGELTILNRAGHNLQIEREEEFSRIFLNWLEKVRNEVP